MKLSVVMMKKILIFVFILLLFGTITAKAQESIFQQIKLEYLDELIRLAKENYPQRQVMARNETQAKSRISATRASYLDVVNVSYFYRPEDRAVANPNNPFVFNGFQFGVSLSPGMFVQRIYQVREAKAAYEISQLESQAYEGVLENEVKSRYYDYVISLDQIKQATQSVQDVEALLEDARLRYGMGEIDIQTYSGARETASNANTALKQAEITFLKARDALEELVGVELSTIE